MIILTYIVRLGQFFKTNIIINPSNQKLGPGNEQLDFVYAPNGWNMNIIILLSNNIAKKRDFPLIKK